MIIGENATIHLQRREAPNIPWIHLVVDAFWIWLLALRDTGFKVYDTDVRSRALQLFEGVAPDVGKSTGLEIDPLAVSASSRWVNAEVTLGS